MKSLRLFGLAVILMLMQVSCSTDSSVTVVITDDDLIGDVSAGPALVGAAINGFGEWVATGSMGIAMGSGSATDFYLVLMGMGSNDADKAVDLNDNGNYILAIESAIYYGDLSGAMTQVYAGNNGSFIAADINNNDVWLVDSEDGLFIGGGNQEAVFLDYVNNIGEFSHCAINDYDEFIAAGSLQTLFGYVDSEGVVELFSYESVAVTNDSMWTDINDYGEFIATGTLTTLIGVSDAKGPKVNRVVRSGERAVSKARGESVQIKVPTVSSDARFVVHRNYTPYFESSKTRLKVSKALPMYHGCVINNYTEYVAAGDDYLLVNDVNFNPVTDYNQMVRVDLNDMGYWVAAGTYGLYVDGSYVLDAMNTGDYLALKQDAGGDYVYCTSQTVYDYSMTSDALINDGPIADYGYPVAADMEGRRWVAVGNYGILLWNY